MQMTIEIPDAVITQLKLNGRSVSRELLEAFAVEGYRTDGMFDPNLRSD